jgi:cytochrome c-type biogenesis protein CcmH/NrfG
VSNTESAILQEDSGSFEKDSNYWHQLAQSYLNQARLEDAIEACQNALASRPKFPSAYICLGRIYQQQEKWDEAIAAFKTALEIQPKLANAHVLLAEIYDRQGLAADAISAYESSLSLQPEQPHVHFKLGELYRQNAQLDKGFSAYYQALKTDSEAGLTYFRRLLRLGFISLEAGELFEQYVARYPELVQPLAEKIQHRSALGNIYHCCPPRTGSQWMKGIFQDFRVFQYCGLSPWPVELVRGMNPVSFNTAQLGESLNPILPNTIVTGTFTINFERFTQMPKPEQYKAFFVVRDPRDMVVSTYFANKKSHRPSGHIAQTREILNQLSVTDGLLYQIKSLKQVFETMHSWLNNQQNNPNAIVVKFEQLTGSNQFEAFRDLFQHCEIQMPESILKQLLEDNSFKKLSGGREKGQEDSNSHYRKGLQGDWKNYFTDEVYQNFTEVTGDLVERLGYP